MLGRKKNLNVLVDYNPLWEAAFIEESQRLGRALGNVARGNAGVPGHYIFGRGRDSTERTHLVHVVEFLGEEWRSNLALRDALRRDPRLRISYLKIKEDTAAAAPEGRLRYNQLKAAFIARIKAELK